MEFVIGLIVVAFVMWLIARRRSGSPARRSGGSASGSRFRSDIDAAVQRDHARAASSGELRRVERRPSADHLPPPPILDAVEAWSPRTQQLEVAGEWYRAVSLRELFTRHARISETGAEVHLPAVLVPDPTNPYDKRAVAVFVDGLHVGYMERPDAARYHGPIADLPGGQIRVASRQWLRGTSDDTWARVTLSLPEPEHLACPNPRAKNCVSLPPGSTIQVTREEEHMEHLAPLVSRFGSEAVLAATLRSVTLQRPRSTVELVAVDIDGQQVGVLSPIQTANFLPLVRRAETEGREVMCRASLRGNALKADVALHARKAHEFDDETLEGLFA